ncbi:MAG: hypothetical protein A2Z72_05210 [Omnitrophica bacterium RBG_13_46_9]|nr:MAG: hypothetical protein A2Z72_05210 [Omnitrophica bacterium RBG_13_46_9]
MNEQANKLEPQKEKPLNEPAPKPSQEEKNVKSGEAPAQKQPDVKPAPDKGKGKPQEAPETQKTLERPKECVVCGKSIKKLWYYRESRYYCNKACWKKSKKTEGNEPEKKK